MKFNALAHLAFKVSNIDRSLDFYCGKLGLRQVFSITYGQLMEGVGREIPSLKGRENELWLTYIEFAPRQFVELFTAVPGMERGVCDDNHIGYLHFALEVEDIHAAKAELEAAGVEITSGPSFGPEKTWQMWVADPDGNRFEMMQYTPESWQLR